MLPIAYSYARFSHPSQAEGDSIRRQTESAERYAQEHGLHLDTQLRDDGISAYRGRHRAEGALGAFVDSIADGRVQAGSYLLLDSYDRMSRETPTESLGLLLDIIRRGVIVVFVRADKVFDKRADPYLLMWALMEAQRSHEESVEKGEKVGIARARERKKARENLTPSTPVGPHWLKLEADPDGRKFWVQVPDRVAVVQRIFEWKEEGLGYAAIARRLNALGEPTPRARKAGAVWSEATVSDLIHSRTVLGEYAPHIGHRSSGGRKPDGPPIPGFYPAIIEASRFDRVHAGIRSRQNANAQPRSGDFKNLMLGLVRCGECGGTVGFARSATRPTARGNQGVLRCNNVNRGVCGNRTRLRYQDVENELLPFLAGLPPTQATEGVAAAALAAAKHERDSVQAKIDALLDAIEAGSGVGDRLHARERERSALSARIAALEREAAVERAQASAPDWRTQWTELTMKMQGEQGEALHALRARLNVLIARAVPLGFTFRDGRLFARFSQTDPKNGRRKPLYYGTEGGVISWEFGGDGPDFDQLKIGTGALRVTA